MLLGEKKGTGYFTKKQLELYGPDGVEYMNKSAWLKKYIQRKQVANKKSAKVYRAYINTFLYFVYKHKNSSDFDVFIEDLKVGALNPYDVLAEFAAFLSETNTKANAMHNKVKTSKKFLRFCGIKIDNEDFKEQILLPRKERPDLKPVDMEGVRLILNNAKPRLKTSLILIGAMGCRTIEACAVRNCDVDLEKRQLTFRKEYTKMRIERTRPMTRELVKQIRTWLEMKYQAHRVVHHNGKSEWVTPKARPDDLLLATWHEKPEDEPQPQGLYNAILEEYGKLAQRIKLGKYNGRKAITMYSFRRFAKSTISDLGLSDYSEWFIGHAGSTYYRRTEKERAEAYARIEPYLTFMDIGALEKHHADLQSELEATKKELATKVSMDQMYEFFKKHQQRVDVLKGHEVGNNSTKGDSDNKSQAQG